MGQCVPAGPRRPGAGPGPPLSPAPGAPLPPAHPALGPLPVLPVAAAGQARWGGPCPASCGLSIPHQGWGSGSPRQWQRHSPCVSPAEPGPRVGEWRVETWAGTQPSLEDLKPGRPALRPGAGRTPRKLELRGGGRGRERGQWGIATSGQEEPGVEAGGGGRKGVGGGKVP